MQVESVSAELKRKVMQGRDAPAPKRQAGGDHTNRAPVYTDESLSLDNTFISLLILLWKLQVLHIFVLFLNMSIN